MTPIEMVREFHVAFGRPINNYFDATQIDLRHRLLDEEVEEFGDAAAVGDAVGMLDALGDIIYVDCGAALCFGFGDDLVYEITPIETKFRLVAPLRFPDHMMGRLEQAAAALRELVSLIDYGTSDKVRTSLGSIYLTCINIAQVYGLPLYDALVEIHRTNMAKLGGERRADGKIMKPQGWTPPDLHGALVRAREAWLDAA